MNALYSEFSHIYDVICMDRNFEREIHTMLQNVERRRGSGTGDTLTYVELFSGPAYHSIALEESGWTGNVYAIDNSADMKSRAIERGFTNPDNYIVDDVLGGMLSSSLPSEIDLVTVMRFSLGLIPPSHMADLIDAVARRLAPGGQMYVELHRLDFLTQSLADLDIRERAYKKGAATYKCTWPHGEVTWDRWRKHVSMQILIEEKVGTTVERYETTSKEHIYSLDDLEREAQRVGLDVRPCFDEWMPIFPESNLVVLEKRM